MRTAYFIIFVLENFKPLIFITKIFKILNFVLGEVKILPDHIPKRIHKILPNRTFMLQ